MAPARRRPLCQPPPQLHGRPSVSLPLSPPALQGPPPLPGSASTFSFRTAPATGSRLRGGAPLTPPPGDLGRDLHGAAAGCACAQGERARAREAALCGETLVHPGCSSFAFPNPAVEKLVTSPGVCDIPSAASCCRSSGEGNRTARRAEDDLPPENISSWKAAQVGKDAGHTEAHEVRTYRRTHRSLL